MFSLRPAAPDSPAPGPRLRLGIFARVYAYDLLLAAIAVGACALVVQYLIESKLKRQVHAMAHWMVHEAFAIDDAAARERYLRRLYDDGQVRMTLYDAAGLPLGAGGPVFPLPAEEELAQLRRSGEEGFTGEEARLSFAVTRGGALAGYGFVGPAATFSIGFGVLPALLILGAVAVIAWPLAVSLLRPVRTLGDTMQRFGAGDLAARVPRPGSDEIGELGRGFNQLAARIQELLQSEKMLLASVSHELRTPLQRVRLALELAMDAGGGPDPRHLGSVAADLQDLDELLSEVLVVARLDPARAAADGLLRKQRVPPDELVAECVERFEAAHPERTVRWLEGPPLPPCEIDARFVMRALGNLLENAARYSPAEEPIEIACWTEGGEWVVAVRDRGPGVPEELRERIFEPFFQGEEARGGGAGSGLGLSIVRRIAEAHGGWVAVASSAAGSEFRIGLPVGTDSGA